MAFALGPTSLSRLEGVHPALAGVVKRAIELTTQDFTVMQGLRTLEEQQAAVAAGHSKTMASKHLPQPDGFAHAVDLVPWVGQPSWDWSLIYPIAAAMKQAAAEHAVMMRWGGAWDRLLAALPPDIAGLRQAVQQYQERHPGPDFLDGPHYELV